MATVKGDWQVTHDVVLENNRVAHRPGVLRRRGGRRGDLDRLCAGNPGLEEADSGGKVIAHNGGGVFPVVEGHEGHGGLVRADQEAGVGQQKPRSSERECRGVAVRTAAHGDAHRGARDHLEAALLRLVDQRGQIPAAGNAMVPGGVTPVTAAGTCGGPGRMCLRRRRRSRFRILRRWRQHLGRPDPGREKYRRQREDGRRRDPEAPGPRFRGRSIRG